MRNYQAGAAPQNVGASPMRRIALGLAASLVLGGCLRAPPAVGEGDVGPTSTSRSAASRLCASPVALPTRASPTAVGAAELPLATAARVLWGSWSPNGGWLSYWTWTPEEVEIDYTYPPGSLHFIDIGSGTTCEAPFEVAYPYFTSTLVWTRDGTAWGLTSDGKVFGFLPCQAHADTTTVEVPEKIADVSLPPGPRVAVAVDGNVDVVSVPSPDSTLLLGGETTDFLFDIHTHQSRSLQGRAKAGSYSPDGRWIASDEAGPKGPESLVTRIRSLATGEVVAQVGWRQQPAEGQCEPPEWLDDTQVLINCNVLGGPLLLGTNGQVAEVDADFFHRECGPSVCQTLAAPSDPVHDWHIVMADPAGSSPAPWLIYHPEAGTIESLPALDLLGLSTDGQWLSGIRDLSDVSLWVRRIDPIGALPILVPAHLMRVPLSWSPDSSALAYGLVHGVGSLLLPGCEEVGWSLGDYSPVSILWSPDNRHLAIQASDEGAIGAMREALFIVNVR